jgi:NitT/TauT family transport system substrate-binding protein
MKRLLLLLIASFLLIAQAQAQTKPVKPATRLAAKIGIGGRGVMPFLPIELAKALGYFEDENVDAELVYFASAPTTLAALHAGQVDYTGNGVGEALNSTLAGKPAVLVASFTYNPGMVLAVDVDQKDKIRSIADLKGRKIGVSSLRSGTHLLVNAILANSGLKESDVTLVVIGIDTAPAALKARQVDALALYDPFATILKNQGKIEWIVDLANTAEVHKYLGGDYQFTALLTTQETAKNKHELTQRVVDALYRTCRYIQTSSVKQIADVMPTELKGGNPAAFVQGLEHLKGAFAPECKPTITGVKNEIAAEVTAKFRTQAEVQGVDPAKMIDLQFVNNAARRAQAR